MPYKPLSDHQRRLNQAIATMQAKKQAGTLEAPYKAPWPRLECSSPDLNKYDNVIDMKKHPKWSWSR